MSLKFIKVNSETKRIKLKIIHLVRTLNLNEHITIMQVEYLLRGVYKITSFSYFILECN